ncbi:MAG: AAA family ATPase [Ignavibacteriales bacterium]|nr:AAA family ATPase [Ignavibacteriales bacterium]
MAPNAATRMELIEQSKISSGNSDEVRKRLNQLLTEGEISQRDISKFTRYSTSVISQALSDSYEGDVEKIEDALARFYRNWLAKNAVVETGVVKEIHATMMLAWKRKEMARITGLFGRGKSKALSRFVALNSDFALYLELTSTTSAASLLHRLADALNISSKMSGSTDDKLYTIIRELQRYPKLLVIDEADNLKPRTLAILKDIHGDESAERCAIVLAGTDRLKKLLLDPTLGYLRRRIRITREIGEITQQEAKKIVDMWTHNLDGQDLKEMWDWSVRKFGVASLVALMTRSYDVMQMSNKKKIDSDCVEMAYSYLVD